MSAGKLFPKFWSINYILKVKKSKKIANGDIITDVSEITTVTLKMDTVRISEMSLSMCGYEKWGAGNNGQTPVQVVPALSASAWRVVRDFDNNLPVDNV